CCMGDPINMGTPSPISRPWGVFAGVVPSLKVPADDGGEAPSPLRVIVQAGDEAEALAAFGQKGLATLHLYFFQGFDAVGQETGAHDVHLPDALAGPGAQSGLGIGLQPFLRPETTLKRHADQ